MIKGKKGKNIKNIDGIVRRKKALNFGRVWKRWDNRNRVPSVLLILLMLLQLVAGYFMFPMSRAKLGDN